MKRAVSMVLATVAIMSSAEPELRLVIIDPGHFHATLIQREMYAGISPHVAVYGPLGPELLDYLTRVSAFNNRKDDPTRWEMDIHTTNASMDQVARDKPGNVAIFTGRNRGKIDKILAALIAGMNVFADKPWIISSADMPKLEQALELADKRGLTGYDIMTERFEITSILQRELVRDPAIFGQLATGTPDRPAIEAKSIHHVMKVVAGMPLRRPTWFFDIEEYGEGLADVGTHVVDLVQWTAFPDQAIDYRKDIEIVSGKRWPLTLDAAQFKQVTGEASFPPTLQSHVRDNRLEYFCNNAVNYKLRGSYVNLEILWNWEAPAGAGDVYEATFRGTKARIELRQGAPEKHRPEVYVVPESADVAAALKARVSAWQKNWPGVGFEERGSEFRITIPEQLRVGHEAHFAQVAKLLFEYIRHPKSMPAWERPNMLAKYYVSTRGVEAGVNRH